MEQEKLRLEIGGAELPELYEDLINLEVELDDELAGMVRISLAVPQRGDGTWPYLDDERIQLWQPVVITAGLGDEQEKLLSGYITHLRPDFAGDPDQCQLEIWGMDSSVLMDRRTILKDWPNRKDSDIAEEVFGSYGLGSDVTDTEIIHDADVSTIIQRETDIRFLKRLARRNGFECYVSGTMGYFGPPALHRRPQPVLQVQCGEETTVTRFAVEVAAQGPSPVAMTQLDHLTKEILGVAVEKTSRKLLGAKPPAAYLPAGMNPELTHLGQTVTTGGPEMEVLCQGLHDRGEWFVTGEGEVAANQYGTILMPRRTVTIKGIGETYSGVYYVSRVTHVFTPGGYTQVFTVQRNALLPTGSEEFSPGGPNLPF
ncbi:phage late control D family protein [Arthrobacter sp. GCM10027362]|uniref:phage late control D family protein n=1 Tax=Arthrobacter sp. GCM10027362 TaxID=3273379 RepID=UPI00362C9182